MTEGITYNPLGTVEVTFDDTTYKLGRPKMRQFKYFTERLQTVTTAYTDEIRRVQVELAEANEKYAEDDTTPEAKAEIDRLTDEVKAITQTVFYEETMAITAEIFRQLGDQPLPEDYDEWPVWLAADASVPGEILKHWRTNPKASGPPPPM